jgi:hypothetical protein
MDKIAELEYSHKIALEGEEVAISKRNTVERGKYYFIPPFEQFNVVYALYDLYIIKNYASARQHFYNAASIALYNSNVFNRRVMDNGLSQICYALLSDNQLLIDQFSHLKNDVNSVSTMPYQIGNAIQNIIQKKWDKLDKNLDDIRRFVALTKFKSFTPYYNLFSGFKNNDKDLIENTLNEMLKNHKKRIKMIVGSDFLSLDTAGFCKLAWLQGYEINLHNDFVPHELMLIKPLPHYKVLNFLLD